MVAESDVPHAFSRGRLRLIDSFAAFNERGQMCSLELLEAGTPERFTLRVEGVLLEPNEDINPQGKCKMSRDGCR